MYSNDFIVVKLKLVLGLLLFVLTEINASGQTASDDTKTEFLHEGYVVDVARTLQIPDKSGGGSVEVYESLNAKPKRWYIAPSCRFALLPSDNRIAAVSDRSRGGKRLVFMQLEMVPGRCEGGSSAAAA